MGGLALVWVKTVVVLKDRVVLAFEVARRVAFVASNHFIARLGLLFSNFRFMRL